MKEKIQTEQHEINLFRVLGVMWHNAIAIIVCGIVGAAIAFSYTVFMVTPLYQANCMIYVNNSSFSVGGSSFSISSSDISASQSLVDTYIVILKSRATLNEVIEEAGLDMSYGQLNSMVSAGAVDETEIFRITVTSPDPEEAKLIANTIADVLPVKVSDIIDGSSVRVVDYAVKPSVKASPSITKNTGIGLLAGLALMALIVILLDLFDDVIRDDDYLAQNFDIPILASIPNLGGEHDKYKYSKYGYGKYGYRSYRSGYRSYRNSYHDGYQNAYEKGNASPKNGGKKK